MGSPAVLFEFCILFLQMLSFSRAGQPASEHSCKIPWHTLLMREHLWLPLSLRAAGRKQRQSVTIGTYRRILEEQFRHSQKELRMEHPPDAGISN